MTCSIFLKTCAKDYPWLPYCLRSIVRFARGLRSVVVLSDDDGTQPPIGAMEQWNKVKMQTPGYAYQQVFKCNADAWVDSDLILFMDSDTIFTKPITPRSFLSEGLPIWLYESYDVMSNPDVLARRDVVSNFVGSKVEHEFMRRHPFIITRELLVEARRFCWRQHGMSIDEYLVTTQNVSEFNFLGAFCWHHRHDSIAWRKPHEEQTYVLQKWSHGGLTDEIRAELEGILQ